MHAGIIHQANHQRVDWPPTHLWPRLGPSLARLARGEARSAVQQRKLVLQCTKSLEDQVASMPSFHTFPAPPRQRPAGQARPAVHEEPGGPGGVDPRRDSAHARQDRQGVWAGVDQGAPRPAHHLDDQEHALPVPHDGALHNQPACINRTAERAHQQHAARHHVGRQGQGPQCQIQRVQDARAHRAAARPLRRRALRQAVPGGAHGGCRH
eukprot:66231-Chlamydomonas_euryale.AAC.1